MTHNEATGGPSRRNDFLIAAACFVVIVAGMQAATTLLIPFLLSAFVAIICLPPLNWLTGHRIPTVAAVMIITLTLSVAILLLGTFVGSSFSDFSTNLPTYQSRLRLMTGHMLDWLSVLGISFSVQPILDPCDLLPSIGMHGN